MNHSLIKAPVLLSLSILAILIVACASTAPAEEGGRSASLQLVWRGEPCDGVGRLSVVVFNDGEDTVLIPARSGIGGGQAISISMQSNSVVTASASTLLEPYFTDRINLEYFYHAVRPGASYTYNVDIDSNGVTEIERAYRDVLNHGGGIIAYYVFRVPDSFPNSNGVDRSIVQAPINGPLVRSNVLPCEA